MPQEQPGQEAGNGTRGLDGSYAQGGQEGERGLGVSDVSEQAWNPILMCKQSMAMNAVLGGNKPHNQQQQHQSGLGGLAQQFLGGSHSNTGGHGGSSGLVGLAGSLLGGGSKPHNQQQSSGSHGSGGMLGSLLGGHGSVSRMVRPG